MCVPGTLSTLLFLPHVPQDLGCPLGELPCSEHSLLQTPSHQLRNHHASSLPLQQNEAKLDEILRELKSIKDTITNQDERISKLEQQMAKIAD